MLPPCWFSGTYIDISEQTLQKICIFISQNALFSLICSVKAPGSQLSTKWFQCLRIKNIKMIEHPPVLPRLCSCGRSRQFTASCLRSSRCGRWPTSSGRRWAACPPLSTLTAPWRLSNCSALPRQWRASFTLTQVKTFLHADRYPVYVHFDYNTWLKLVNTQKTRHGHIRQQITLVEKKRLAERLWTHRKSKQHRGGDKQIWTTRLICKTEEIISCIVCHRVQTGY